MLEHRLRRVDVVVAAGRVVAVLQHALDRTGDPETTDKEFETGNDNVRISADTNRRIRLNYFYNS